MKQNKKAQIWVETVIYTLIGLVIIGIVLSVATPAIQKYKDGITIEQTITALNDMNGKILEAKTGGVGNVRVIEFRIKEGKLMIDSGNDTIDYLLEESKLEYSEPGITVKQGEIDILTEKKGKKFDITLSLNYSESLNLTYGNADNEKIFNKASLLYKLSIENKGVPAGSTDGLSEIKVEEVS